MFVWPHGIHVDRDGNVWVTDARAPGADDFTKYPGEDKKGSVVIKFSPDGKVLMTIGKPGVRGNPPDALTDPTDVVTDPRNGDVYIAESHTDVTDPNLIGRISVFDKNGKFLRVIGKTGTGPGEFRTPHALEFDSKGRLIVADRHNHRIQILTKTGKFVLEYDDFGRTSGLAIDKNDVIYTADSESTAKVHPGWQRGIRIGSLKDGKVTIFIPPHMTPNSPDGAIPFAGLVQGDDGRLYGTTVQGGMNLLGTVFRLGTNGDDYAVLHGFAGLPDGGAPEAELTRGLDGALYGTTVAGGTNGLGTIFKINPDGGGYANLYCFAASPDGAHPYGGLVQGGDGRLYGTTTWGGNANGGTIYRINTNGSGYSVLYHFGSSDADGVLPYASLTAGPNGILYGTTLEGGTNGFGTIYRFAVPPTLSIALLPQGMPQLTLTGFTNYVCHVQAATNFEHWVAFTNVMLTNGVSQMIDPAFPALPQRFYRAVVQ